MARALRELFAEFRVEFDRRRELRRGQMAITGVRRSLERADAGVRRLQGAAGQLGVALGGAALVAGMQRMVSGIMAIGDELDKVSEQVGLTAQQFQAYQHAAGLSGVSSNDFANAMARLTKNARDAAQGSGEYADSFEALGVSVTDANGELAQGDELLRRVADGMAATESPAERTALAMDIMGRSGRQMVPMLSGGSEALVQMEDELEELGGGMSDVAIENSVKLTDAVARLKLGMRSMGGVIAEKAFPWLERLAAVATKTVTAFSEMRSKVAVLQVALVALGGLLAGAALATIGIWGPMVLAAAAVTILYLAFQDLYVAIKGGDSVTEDLLNSLGHLFGKAEFGTNLLRGLRQGWSAFWTLLDQGVGTCASLAAAIGDLWDRGSTGAMVAAVLLSGVLGLYTGVTTLGQGLGWLLEQLDRVPGALQALADSALQTLGPLGSVLQAFGVEDALGGGLEALAGNQGGRERVTEESLPTLSYRGVHPPGSVDARMETTININEASDSGETRREVESVMRDVQERQIRDMRGTHVGGA